jgi:hypothetical protein
VIGRFARGREREGFTTQVAHNPSGYAGGGGIALYREWHSHH